MSLLAGPLYTLFFGYDPESVGYFQMALLASLFFSLFTIPINDASISEPPSFCDSTNCRSNYPESHLPSNRTRSSWRIRDGLIKWLGIRYRLCSWVSLYVQRIPNSTFSKNQQFFLKNFPITLIMLAVCFIIFFLLNQRLPMESKSYAMVYCVALGSIGGLVFLFFSIRKNGFRMLKNVKHRSGSKE